MNPSNSTLSRTYFIAGPPRVGKTILAYALAERIRGHVVSTDAIRSAAKKACVDKNSDLFLINKENDLSEQEWLKRHVEQPELVVEDQNKESIALWPSLVSFCNTFCEDSAVHIVEGVALLPSLVAAMKHGPEHVIYVGNTSAEHLQGMTEYAARFPEQDWMAAMEYGPEKIAGMANVVRTMSLYFKAEAEKYGFPYYEISDSDFEGSIERIVESIMVI